MIEIQLGGGIHGLNFGYDAKMEGYTNSCSDIPQLYEIPNPAFEKGKLPNDEPIRL